MDLLRFITCGSVDNGKSTLIGRMLYDSKAIQTDLLEAIQEASRRNGKQGLDLSLLTDGLKAEREQGITIDVAYKYFNTEKRKFIIADAPGHVQYTRNMVTGASTAKLAVLLVDARAGIIEQTRRHTYITALLHLPHIVLAVNKMDLVDYSQECYEKIRKEFLDFINNFHFEIDDVTVIPVSALAGDNVVHHSEKMLWYKGASLLDHLSSVEIENDENLNEIRFPVQGVIRPQSRKFPDYRSYSGCISGGLLHPGDSVKILPDGLETRISKIMLGKKELKEAYPPSSVTLLLEDDIDISRGALIIGKDQEEPVFSQECTADICWMDTKLLKPNEKYILYHTNREITVSIIEIVHHINIHSLKPEKNRRQLGLNDLGRIRLKTQEPLYYDSYAKNRRTGSFILVETGSFSTVAAGMLL